MRTILLLFTKRIVVLLALVVFCGPVIFFNLDKRIGVFFMGVIFAMAGAGNLITHSDDPMKGVRIAAKIIGWFLLAVGILMAICAVLLFVTGRPVK